jgi:hypothetical protein
MKPYRLAPSVYACASEDGAVFLNLGNDAYLGIDFLQSRALSLVVEDWPRHASEPRDDAVSSASENRAVAGKGSLCEPLPCTPPENSGSNPEALSFAEFLGERGLLVRTSCDSPAIIETDAAIREPVSSPQASVSAPAAIAGTLADRIRVSQLPSVESELIAWQHMSWEHIRVSHVFRFLQSLITAICLLHCCRFSDVVHRAHRRSAAHARNSLHPPTVRALLSAFFHIRTFVYAPKDRCLLDSLTLLEFLAHYGQHPRWVLGVQVIPFGSHSWVQHDAFVLNGTPEYVRAYTPILVI